jgi:HEAT repeat protein
MSNQPRYVPALLEQLGACMAAWPPRREPLEALAAMLALVPVTALPQVDHLVRAGAYRVTPWFSLRAADLAPVVRVPEAWAVAALASGHRDGRVREAVVRALGEAGDGRVLPFIVLRLNDWVPEVRRAANAALAAYVRPAFARHLLAALPLVQALERQQRADHGRVVAWVLTLLRTPECRQALRDGCLATEVGVRRTSYGLWFDADDADRPALLGQAQKDREPAIRLWAARAVARAMLEPWAERLALRALNDRSVQVRRVALAALAARLPAERGRVLVEGALLDENTTARWQARVLRLTQGPVDLGEFYRRALAGATTAAGLRGALLGLGESGTRADVSLANAHLGDARVSVRRAAIRALAGLVPTATTEPFLAALVDPEPGVSREGRRALDARVAHLTADRLAALARDESLPPHAQLGALSLVTRLPKWDAVAILVECRCLPGEAIAARTLALLDVWRARYNSSFVLPTAAQVAALERALALAATRLGAGSLQDVRSILKVVRS